MPEPNPSHEWTNQDVRYLLVSIGLIPLREMTPDEVEFAFWDKQFWAADIDEPETEDD